MAYKTLNIRNEMYAINAKKTTPAGFEPALPKEMPTYLSYNIAGHRVNHSAKAPSFG